MAVIQKERGYRSFILKRRRRRVLIRTTKTRLFSGGDIVLVGFELCGIQRVFKGICVSKQCKSLTKVSSSLRLRNVVEGIGIEITLPLYCLCFRFSELALFDYERKRFRYRSSKLYHLRDKPNSLSLVKFQWRTVLW